MPDAPGCVWLRQACSDLDAGERLRSPPTPAFYCQAVSKYQQAVEKAIKGIVADLQAGGVPLVHIGRREDFRHGVRVFAAALIRIPRKPRNADLPNLLYGLLYPLLGEIHALDSLVPKRPAAGVLAPRNTEYPYQDRSAGWRAPADPGSFDPQQDVERFRKLAHKTVRDAGKILTAIARRPR
jgi:hypothetical protein